MRFPILVFTQVGSAIFEGVTIFLILLAAQLLIEGTMTSLTAFPEIIQTFIGQFALVEIIVILIVVAVFGQLIKSGLDCALIIIAARLKALSAHFLYHEVISNVLHLEYGKISRMKAGVINEGLNQTDQLAQIMIFVTLNRALHALIMLIGYIVFMLIISPTLTLAATAVLTAIYLPATFLSHQLRELGKKYAEESLSLGGVAMQYLNSPRLIKLFGRTDSAIQEMSNAKSQILYKRQKSDILTAIVDPLVKGFFNIGIGAILLVGVLWWGSESRGIAPTVVAFLVVAGRMQGSLSILNVARMRLLNSLGLLEAVGRLLRDQKNGSRRKRTKIINRISTDITIEKISFQYDPRTDPVINCLSLKIARGETVGITGPSGSGKSTLVDLLLGLYDVESGQIKVNDTNLVEIDRASWMERIGVVDQQPFLFNGSIRENIAFGAKDATDADIHDAAVRAHAAEFIGSFPKGYDTQVGDRGVLLSGGQIQRITIARALVRKPELLVFDEATSALDSHSEKLIQKTVEAEHGKATVVVVSHRLSTLVSADRIIVLDKGRIVEQGTPKALIAQDGIFKRMWDAQLRATNH